LGIHPIRHHRKQNRNTKEQYKNSLQELENLYGSLSQRAFSGELEFAEKKTATAHV
jgi:hypothetical protein